MHGELSPRKLWLTQQPSSAARGAAQPAGIFAHCQLFILALQRRVGAAQAVALAGRRLQLAGRRLELPVLAALGALQGAGDGCMGQGQNTRFRGRGVQFKAIKRCMPSHSPPCRRLVAGTAHGPARACRPRRRSSAWRSATSRCASAVLSSPCRFLAAASWSASRPHCAVAASRRCATPLASRSFCGGAVHAAAEGARQR